MKHLITTAILIFTSINAAHSQTYLPNHSLPSINRYPKEVCELYTMMDKGKVSSVIAIIIQDSTKFYCFKNEKFQFSGENMLLTDFCKVYGIHGCRVGNTSKEELKERQDDYYAEGEIPKYRMLTFTNPMVDQTPFFQVLGIAIKY